MHSRATCMDELMSSTMSSTTSICIFWEVSNSAKADRKFYRFWVSP